MAPAAAAAPTVTTDRACYAAESEQVVLLNGSGYTPLAPLTVTVTGRRGALSFQTTADASGALANVPLKVPTLTEPGFTDRRRPSATIAVTDTGVVPAVAATTQITVTTWGVEVVPWYRRVPARPPAPRGPLTDRDVGLASVVVTADVSRAGDGRLKAVSPRRLRDTLG